MAMKSPMFKICTLNKRYLKGKLEPSICTFNIQLKKLENQHGNLKEKINSKRGKMLQSRKSRNNKPKLFLWREKNGNSIGRMIEGGKKANNPRNKNGIKTECTR